MDGLRFSVPCATFSLDSTLMAAGFSESYIRLFSLKQEKLRGMRSDFQESSIRDCERIYGTSFSHAVDLRL